MRTRQDYEEFENQYLASYAMKSRESRGRKYDEESHPTRTCYQRDRDRIVHSEAFRKLEYKTQVFIIFEGDYYRTRLTHTIEVAQIARTIGRALKLNEDLIEAIALAHDLGHPPFGHAGEYALDHIMQSQGLHFNHNVHSFDIVTRLEKRYPHFDGLNLSKEVLVGILKHNTVYDIQGDDDYDDFIDEGATLEAQVVDIADSLAYLSHDIDDGLKSGCILEEDLMESKMWRRVYDMVGANLKTQDREMFKYQIIKNLIDLQAKDLLAASDERLKAHDFKSVSDVKALKKTILGFSPQMTEERDFLQGLLNEKLYHHFRVERMTAKGARILNDLFDVYQKNPGQLPYYIYQRKHDYSAAEKYKIICNYIASMTDRFAFDEHKKLFDPYRAV